MEDLSWIVQHSSTSQELELRERTYVRLQKHNPGALATSTTSTFWRVLCQKQIHDSWKGLCSVFLITWPRHCHFTYQFLWGVLRLLPLIILIWTHEMGKIKLDHPLPPSRLSILIQIYWNDEWLFRKVIIYLLLWWGIQKGAPILPAPLCIYQPRISCIFLY